MIDSCQHIMDTCLTVILLHDNCTQTYTNLHKLFTLHCNFICVLSVVIIKTDDDDDDDDPSQRHLQRFINIFTYLLKPLLASQQIAVKRVNKAGFC